VRVLGERANGTSREPAAASGDKSRVAASPPDAHRAWTAEIEWRLTDAGPRFCVIARGGNGAGELAVAQSAPLDWPPNGPASVRALTEATKSLEAALLAAGWLALPHGGAWYAKRFAWEPIGSVVGAERAEADPIEPAPAAEARPSAPKPATSPASPVWVEPVGDLPAAQRESAVPVPAPESTPVVLRPPRRALDRYEGGTDDGAGAGIARRSDAADVPRGHAREWRRRAGSASSARRATGRTVPVAMVAVLVVAAVIAGVQLGRSFGGGSSDAPAPPAAKVPQTIAHGGLRLHVPSGWVRRDAATVHGFSRALELVNEGHRLSAVVEQLPATSATLLPVALERMLPPTRTRPEVVQLASGPRAWRYRLPGEDGSTTVLYAAPTTSGVATLACVSPSESGVPRGCEALVRTLTVPGSKPLALGPSAAFYSRLAAAVGDLDTARSKGMRELFAATRAKGQAAAAEELVRAHKAAVAALAPLMGEDDSLPAETVAALTAVATAYATIGSAARARSPRRYADARRAVTGADSTLRRTLRKVAAAENAATYTTSGQDGRAR
jgi:hypothetical protein